MTYWWSDRRCEALERTGGAPTASEPQARASRAEARPAGPVPVYSVWFGTRCIAVCDTPERAAWWTEREPGSVVEVTERQG